MFSKFLNYLNSLFKSSTIALREKNHPVIFITSLKQHKSVLNASEGYDLVLNMALPETLLASFKK